MANACHYCGAKFGMRRHPRGFRVYCTKRCLDLATANWWLTRVLQFFKEMWRLDPYT